MAQCSIQNENTVCTVLVNMSGVLTVYLKKRFTCCKLTLKYVDNCVYICRTNSLFHNMSYQQQQDLNIKLCSFMKLTKLSSNYVETKQIVQGWKRYIFGRRFQVVRFLRFLGFQSFKVFQGFLIWCTQKIEHKITTLE